MLRLTRRALLQLLALLALRARPAAAGRPLPFRAGLGRAGDPLARRAARILLE